MVTYPQKEQLLHTRATKSSESWSIPAGEYDVKTVPQMACWIFWETICVCSRKALHGCHQFQLGDRAAVVGILRHRSLASTDEILEIDADSSAKK